MRPSGSIPTVSSAFTLCSCDGITNDRAGHTLHESGRTSTSPMSATGRREGDAKEQGGDATGSTWADRAELPAGNGALNLNLSGWTLSRT
jgi:hypothetical protein